ncbi:hypothetical protein [Aeromicrobium alkaliterrae]|uniref:Uncharacterized protein n=1 Tax=Aeromicrobium alkaliterrae TaxID=302168 RepID=A0ABP4VH81_9ACTN
MAPESVRRLRKWARRRRTPLVIGAVALVLALIAAFLIYRAATEPIVGGDGSDDSNPFAIPSTSSSVPPGATGDITDIGGGNFGLPTGGLSVGCDTVTFTMSFTSNAPITIAGYLTSAGKQDYFPVDSSGTVSVQQCATDPSVLILAQAGAQSTTISCTTTKSGRVAETKSAAGPYGIVACYG